MAKLLHYTGLKPGFYTTVYDKRGQVKGTTYDGPPLKVCPGDKVPLEAYHNDAEHGDVAARHVELGLAVLIEETPEPEPLKE